MKNAVSSQRVCSRILEVLSSIIGDHRHFPSEGSALDCAVSLGGCVERFIPIRANAEDRAARCPASFPRLSRPCLCGQKSRHFSVQKTMSDTTEAWAETCDASECATPSLSSRQARAKIRRQPALLLSVFRASCSTRLAHLRTASCEKTFHVCW